MKIKDLKEIKGSLENTQEELDNIIKYLNAMIINEEYKAKNRKVVNTLGRPKRIDYTQLERLAREFKHHKISAKEICEELDISQSSFYTYYKKNRNKL